ncbi:MAG: bifunctional phosphoglucose/phosphomannose isomerase [Thermoleophilaceae bacterium]|nr:bifunctional phosphoglucose/phosphomannose isomerase [Thermoleophilaceae bacterium]
MRALTREAVAAVDSLGMLGVVLEQAAHLTDALWRVDSASAPRVDAPGGLVVCGMGGSAIGADLAAAALADRAQRPLRTVRGYDIGPGVGPGTLVLCSSYSGDTEETVCCYEQARDAGAPRIALTTGGRLAELARADGVPVIGVPGGIQPRAAVAYMTVGALECAALAGAAPSLRSEVEEASELLAELAREWGPDAPEDSLAKALARALQGAAPVVYGAGVTVPVARRWKTQVNENAKLPAFWADLPEADHNEICGFERAQDFAAVFLDDPHGDPRLRRRLELTAESARRGSAVVEVVEARGESPLARALSLVLLGDLVSVYLAALERTDPTPVDAIEAFKSALR